MEPFLPPRKGRHKGAAAGHAAARPCTARMASYLVLFVAVARESVGLRGLQLIKTLTAAVLALSHLLLDPADVPPPKRTAS